MGKRDNISYESRGYFLGGIRTTLITALYMLDGARLGHVVYHTYIMGRSTNAFLSIWFGYQQDSRPGGSLATSERMRISQMGITREKRDRWNTHEHSLNCMHTHRHHSVPTPPSNSDPIENRRESFFHAKCPSWKGNYGTYGWTSSNVNSPESKEHRVRSS